MSPSKRFFYILALTAMWSPSFLFIKLAIEDFPPFTLVALRVSIAAVVLFLILKWKNGAFPKSPLFWLHSTMMAIFASALPFCLFCYAERTIESALAAMLNGCSPMFTAFLSHFCLKNDRITPQKLLGIILGATGLLLLFSPNITGGIEGTGIGMLAGACAALSYAISHVYAKKYTTGLSPFVAPAAQLIASSAILLPMAFYFESPLQLSMPSASGILGVCGLAFFGTILAFIIYYRLIEHCGPTAISMVACFFPVGGLLLGYLFLGESLSIYSMVASGFIISGLAVVNGLVSFRSGAPVGFRL